MSSPSTPTTTHSDVPLEQQAVEIIVDRRLPLKIMDEEQYTEFAQYLQAIVAWQRGWNAQNDPTIALANQTHKVAIAAKAKYGDPAEARRLAVGRLLGNWNAEQRRLAQQKAEEARETARKAAQKLRDDEAMAERKRADDARLEEQKRRDDAEAARQLAAEASDPAERLELERQASESDRRADEAAGESQQSTLVADQIAATEVFAPALVFEHEATKVKGVSTTSRWHAEVINKKKYVAHVLGYWETLEANIEVLMPPLNRLATNVKKEIEILPGIMARPDHGASVKS
jgi:hypothetical protein